MRNLRLFRYPEMLAPALLLAAAASLPAGAASLVQISGSSPFGALADCGNFPGIFSGTNFVDSEVEPWLDVNPANPSNIVAVWQQDRWSDGGSRGNVAGVSLDGGSSWNIVTIPKLTDCSGGPWERASDPWVSFGPDGTLYQMTLAFQTDPPGDRIGGFGANAMLVSKSENGGLDWSAPVTLIEDDDPRVLNDKNSLTADPTDADYVYAVWDRLKITSGDAIDPENVRPGRGQAFGVRFGLGFKGPIYFARSTDGGDSWEPARNIYDPGANNQTINNRVVVLPDGTLLDVFTEILNNKNSDGEQQFEANLALLRSTDKGLTWTPRGQPQRIAKIQSTGTLSPDMLLPVRDASILFDVAVDSTSGALYAVWQDRRFDGIEQIAFAMSGDGGFTWSTPIKVNQTPMSGNPLRAQAFLPSVAAMATTGQVAVTYYDFRFDDGSGELADYFVNRCNAMLDDCGDPASWSNELRLTDNSFDYAQAPVARGLFLGDYMGLASDSSGLLSAFGIAGFPDRASIFFRRTAP